MRIVKMMLLGGAGLFLLYRWALAAPAATRVQHAEWARSAVIYELNTRQFSQEGTFRAILPRVQELKDLGVGIVWFMPIHPIGEKERKGSLGSPYAVRDFRAVNPEFGTLDDFKAVVAAMHEAGMHVVIDLVANHTAWDNALAAQHPEWYHRDAKGRFKPPVQDWTDVIHLDYAQQPLREYMADTMEYWVRDVGVDGFRCDVAGMVPTSFWNEARRRLERIRPVFMLAEAEKPELLAEAFDCDYASECFRLFDDIAHGKALPKDIDRLLAEDRARYPAGAWRMRFTTNHDQNTWLDSDQARLGPEGSKAFAVLAFTLPGKPLVYTGQEVGNGKRLPFFERGPVAWTGRDAASYRAFYTDLCRLYTTRPALHAGRMARVEASSKHVYAFVRQHGAERLLVCVNLSAGPVRSRVGVPLETAAAKVLSRGPQEVPPSTQERLRVVDRALEVPLEPWGWRVYALEWAVPTE